MNIRFLTNCLIALYCVPLLHGQIITRIDTLRFSAKTPIDTLSSTPVIDNTLLVLQGADPGLTLVSHGSGLVKAANPPVDATDVIVSYQTPAVPLATVYGPAWRYLPSLDDVLPDTAVSANPVSHQASIRTEGGRATSLVSAGSLFRGVQVSTTHGARLTGGLDLAFQGDLGGGLFIDGQLTDQDLPIQPEGNTRTLNELDQVRLGIRSPWGSIQAGDFVLQGADSPLSRFERKLEGMEVRLGDDDWHMQGALAGSRGRFRRQIFQGIDGRQGPYALTTDTGSRLLLILAGTEKVWLNGDRLERGHNQGYVIDYNTGEINFTTGHTIRNDSRIVVEFQYSDLVYDRRTQFIGADYSRGSSNFAVSALSEIDNLESNLEFSLGAGERGLLTDAGDMPGGIMVSTAAQDSAGDYALTDSHYVWHGSGGGDHTVSFFNVGDAGEYRRQIVDNRIVYQWVAPRERQNYSAVYAPFRRITAPQRKDYLAVSLGIGDAESGRSMRVDWGGSRIDLNRYSRLNDDDNLGQAYSANINWQTNPVSLAGKELTLGATLRAQGKEAAYQAPGRFDAVELEREWDLDGITMGYGWQTAGLTARITGEPVAVVQIGQLNSAAALVNRYRWSLNTPSTAVLDTRVEQTILERQAGGRTWDRTGFQVKYRAKKIEPFMTFNNENRVVSDSVGYTVDDLAVGLLARLRENLTATVSREQRRDKFIQQPDEDARLWRMGVQKSAGSGSKVDLSLSVNDKSTGQSSDISYIMGELAWVHRPRDRRWWLDFRYRLDRRVAETKAVVYDTVAAGSGQFRYDAVYDTYVPDPNGEYIRVLLPAGEIVPVNNMQSRLRSQIELNRLPRGLGLWQSHQQARLDLQADLQIQAVRHSFEVYLEPGLLDTTAVKYRSNNRLVLTTQRDRHAPRHMIQAVRSVMLSREESGSLGGTGPTGDYHRETDLEWGRLSSTELGQLPVKLDIHLGRRTLVTRSLINPVRNHDIHGLRGSGTASTSLKSGFNYSLMMQLKRETDADLDDFIATTRISGLGMERRIGSRGRIKIDAERLDISVNQDRAIPYLMAEGFPAGPSYRIRGNGQIYLSGNLILTVNMFHRRPTGGRALTTASVELRTRF